MQRVGVRQHGGQHRVSAFVVRSGATFFGAQHQAFTSGAHHDTVARVFKVNPLDLARTSAYCEQCRFVDEIGEVRTAHSRRCLGHGVHVDVGSHALVARVHLENREALFEFGQRHHDLAIEATRTQQCGIENVGAVGGRQNHDSFGGFKTVHLSEHLVECLFAFVMAATKTGTALAADRVDFIDEDDRLAHLARLLEQVTHAARADTHEHLHEVRARDRQKAHTCFAGDGARKQGLAGSWRTNEQNALGHPCSDLFEALGHPQEVDHLFDLLLDAVIAGHIGKRR